MTLHEQTEKLLKECENCKNRFHKMREENLSPNFFEEVKPYADSIHQLLLEWKQNVLLWIKDNQPKYVHKQQIESVVDSMNQFVVQSFYKETSKKRFLQSIYSVEYTLTLLLRYMNKM